MQSRLLVILLSALLASTSASGSESGSSTEDWQTDGTPASGETATAWETPEVPTATYTAQEQAPEEPDPCGGPFRLRDLSVESIQVSNHDVEQVIAVLETIGYSTIAMDEVKTSRTPPQTYVTQSVDMGDGTTTQSYDPYSTYNSYSTAAEEPEKPKKEKYRCDELPVIVQPPPVSDHRLAFDSSDFLGLSGGGSSSSGGYDTYGDYGGYGSSGGSVGGDISPALHPMSKPHTGETDNLLVFYLEEHKEELHKLRDLVSRQLDVQATQIYVEGLVLEVSADGLDELGVEYARVDPDNNRVYSAGSVSASPVAAGGSPVVNYIRDTMIEPYSNPDRILFELQALVSKGDAEVLSRPSVLTLNNRQATIQIIDIVQFPIQEATITASGDIVQSAFTFEAVRPGITLNLRPRVSPNNEFVSVEIDVTVEALVSANNGEVRSSEGEVIATKPGSSARRVQTFARIPNRTPIIIGGLIASDKEVISNRIPFLGNLPLIGKLFGATSKIEAKREVIIVLTPYIVGEDTSVTDVSVPKDTSLFDVDDATLFVNTYRVRSDDVFDLRFLKNSPDFISRREQVEGMIVRRPELRQTAPFRDFVDGNIPGGSMFLNRMVFDLVKRRDLGSVVTADQLIVLSDTRGGEPRVTSISDLYKQVAGGNQAATIVFRKDDTGTSPGAEVDISSIGNANDFLWRNSYGAGGKGEQYAIVLENESDVDRLVDAVISAAIVDENGGYDRFSVGRFEQGTILSIPNFDEKRFYLVDEKVARVFTDTQHYYRASAEALDRAYDELDDITDSED